MSDLLARAKRVAAIAAQYSDDVDREGRFPHETLRALKEQRLLGIMIPADCGGEAASLDEIAEICACLGQHCASSAMIFAMHQIKVSSLVSHGAASEWHRAYMRRIAADQLLLASATTEAGIGGDLRNSICAVEPLDGERFRLIKDATVISYGAHADAILATTRRAPDAPSSDQVLVVVEKEQYTLRQTANWDTLGMRGTCSEGSYPHGRSAARADPPQALRRNRRAIHARDLASPVVEPLVRHREQCGCSRPEFRPRRRPQAPECDAARRAARRRGRQSAADDEVDDRRRPAALCPRPEERRRIELDGLRRRDEQRQDRRLKARPRHHQHGHVVCGIMGYKNNTPYSLGRHWRDALSAQLMINNDRIFGNTSNLLLVHRLDSHLLS